MIKTLFKKNFSSSLKLEKKTTKSCCKLRTFLDDLTKTKVTKIKVFKLWKKCICYAFAKSILLKKLKPIVKLSIKVVLKRLFKPTCC